MHRIALAAALALFGLGLLIFGEVRGERQNAPPAQSAPAPTAAPVTASEVLSNSWWSHVYSDPIPRSWWVHLLR